MHTCRHSPVYFFDFCFIYTHTLKKPPRAVPIIVNRSVRLAAPAPSFAACICGSNGQTQQQQQQPPTASAETFSAVAVHLKLPYDTRFDYNPQFDGYRRGTVIKQADTVLIGYPLLYDYAGASSASATALRNNLAYYESVMRPTGPAMTWSMHAINHLQLRPCAADDERRADAMFRRGYRPYVRAPFMVGFFGCCSIWFGFGGLAVDPLRCVAFSV